jgi:hypothetical protein
VETKNGLFNVIEASGIKKASALEASELLNQLLRLEYTGITYLPHLSTAAQHADIGFCLTILCNNAIEHAVALASAIRELGGTPDWTVTVPAENDTLMRLFEVQLTRERLCYNLYERTARLLEGSHLASRLITMACEELHHIELIEFVVSILRGEEFTKINPSEPLPVKKSPIFPCDISEN